MLSKLLALPVSNSTDGFLSELKNLIEDFKHISTKHTFFKSFTLKSISKRIDDLIKYKRNYIFNKQQAALYAELVIQFNCINNINSDLEQYNSDSKTSLLNEFA